MCVCSGKGAGVACQQGCFYAGGIRGCVNTAEEC